MAPNTIKTTPCALIHKYPISASPETPTISTAPQISAAVAKIPRVAVLRAFT